jgi:hypothetical protein
MITMRRQVLGLGFVAASSLLALHAAKAMTGPTAIQIDGGPLGPLQLSGGMDGYGYYLSGTNNQGHAPGTNTPVGMNVGNALIELQKTDGQLQFTVIVGSQGGNLTLGSPPIGTNGKVAQTTISNYSTGPLYAGYVTVAPKDMPFTFSVGQVASLEGYESGMDWNNPVALTTAAFFVENAQDRAVEGAYTQGPLSATVSFGDGYDTGVFNFLQALVTYTINSTNNANVFYGGNLGTTGLNAKTYGGTGGYGNPATFGTVATFGPQYINSQMIGGFYSYTQGNLNLVPEVQYQYAKANAKVNIFKPTSNFVAAVFEDYTFGTSPYSVGGWVEYFDSHASASDQAAGTGTWFVGPNAQAIGAAVAPTWQYKYLFARANAGYLYLLHNKDATGVSYGYGKNGNGKGQFLGTLEAGLLF